MISITISVIQRALRLFYIIALYCTAWTNSTFDLSAECLKLPIMIHGGNSFKSSRHKTGDGVTHVKEPRLPFSIFHVLPEEIWHDTSAHHWQDWLTFQPITVESFLPSVVSSGLSITMSALVLVYWSGRAALRVSVSSQVSLSGITHPPSLPALSFCSS